MPKDFVAERRLVLGIEGDHDEAFAQELGDVRIHEHARAQRVRDRQRR
jgi:hypothetical protein